VDVVFLSDGAKMGMFFGKGELEEVNAMQKKSQDEPH